MVTRSARNAKRHRQVADFRRKTYDQLDLVLFPHQAEWQLASEGRSLPPDAPARGDDFIEVRLEDGTITTQRVIPRPNGAAHVLCDFAGFKGGKSYSAGAWPTGFACLSDANVVFVGIEQISCKMEFGYLANFLLSEDEGLGLEFDQYRNEPRDGKMWLKLADSEHNASRGVPGGAYYEVRSYGHTTTNKKSKTLKGDTVDAYIFCEAYQLPGLFAYTSLSQNLRENDGFAVFPTTPDSAYLNVLHDKAHGIPTRRIAPDPYYHCTCGVDAKCNPFTFDPAARKRDDPTNPLGGLMTHERFRVHWGGQVGKPIGQVFDYDQTLHMFTPATDAHLFTPESVAAYQQSPHL